ncbi:hypothetical protein [Aliikangiella sp. IMCC44359]|uniref:hypothetical protein n=1 Tax=Aliikangiella sp. IMCC44359 TaxID=3459125 RepID=UPI00403B1D74
MSEGLQSKNIMIVGKSMVARMMIQDGIMSHYPDWEFIQAASIEKAADSCWEMQFDFIIIDSVISNNTDLDTLSNILKKQKRAKAAIMVKQLPNELMLKINQLKLFMLDKPIYGDDLINFIES